MIAVALSGLGDVMSLFPRAYALGYLLSPLSGLVAYGDGNLVLRVRNVSNY